MTQQDYAVLRADKIAHGDIDIWDQAWRLMAQRDEAHAKLSDREQACEFYVARMNEAVALLRAIWHGQEPGIDPSPTNEEFRRRVEALVGETPAGAANTEAVAW